MGRFLRCPRTFLPPHYVSTAQAQHDESLRGTWLDSGSEEDEPGAAPDPPRPDAVALSRMQDHREPHATQCEMQRKPERVSVLGLKEALLDRLARPWAVHQVRV